MSGLGADEIRRWVPRSRSSTQISGFSGPSTIRCRASRRPSGERRTQPCASASCSCNWSPVRSTNASRWPNGTRSLANASVVVRRAEHGGVIRGLLSRAPLQRSRIADEHQTFGVETADRDPAVIDGEQITETERPRRREPTRLPTRTATGARRALLRERRCGRRTRRVYFSFTERTKYQKMEAVGKKNRPAMGHVRLRAIEPCDQLRTATGGRDLEQRRPDQVGLIDDNPAAAPRPARGHPLHQRVRRARHPASATFMSLPSREESERLVHPATRTAASLPPFRQRRRARAPRARERTAGSPPRRLARRTRSAARRVRRRAVNRVPSPWGSAHVNCVRRIDVGLAIADSTSRVDPRSKHACRKHDGRPRPIPATMLVGSPARLGYSV